MCVATGIPNPQISWLKNDTLLEEDEHIHIMNELSEDDNATFVKSILEIHDAQSNDTSTYTCVASVPRLETANNFNLTVITAPASITSPPINQTVIAGGDVVLSCTATGIPFPSLAWRMLSPVGEEVSNTSSTLIFTWVALEEEVPVVTTTLHVVSLVADSEYSCEASNNYGSDTETAYITLQGTNLCFHVVEANIIGITNCIYCPIIPFSPFSLSNCSQSLSGDSTT